MIINDIYNELNRVVPAHLQLDYDNSGYQVMFGNETLKGIYIALDLTPEVMEDLKNRDVNLIITHHPFFFKSFKKIDFDLPKNNILMELINRKISVLSLHTNLDKIFYDKMAKRVGAIVTDILLKDRDSDYGFGAYGRLEKQSTLKYFLLQVKNNLGVNYLRYSGDLETKILNIAFLNGSGGSEVENICRNYDVDCIVTGDIGYHHIQTAIEYNMPLVDAGHFGTESLFKDFIKELVLDCLTKLNKDYDYNIHVSEVERDPFEIFI